MLLFLKCSSSKEGATTNDFSINLKWYPAYESENQYKIKTGLKWVLAYLGANDLASNFEYSAQWVSDDVLHLDLKSLGFDSATMKIWQVVLSKMKSSETYRTNDYMDIGAFVMETFNNSWTYYALTGVEDNFDQFSNKYKFSDQKKYIVKQGESCVSSLYRLISIAEGESILETAFASNESLSTDPEKGDIKEHEVFDFMRNGQARFAIYDEFGMLASGANAEHSKGGKPSKCMWCHESKMPKIRMVLSSVVGFEETADFSLLVRQKNSQLKKFFRSNNQHFVADSMRQHSYAELLYVTYETPTLQRLRNEGYQQVEINAIKKSIHRNEEYLFLDRLVLDSVVHRSKIDPSFNFTARETNENEINLFK